MRIPPKVGFFIYYQYLLINNSDDKSKGTKRNK